ncbi:MAG: PH domain-containing protein [Candidatus Pacebacteria bacterium]|nr:PH domain-containing protein [Candidatus Paceibacterota bacterium]
MLGIVYYIISTAPLAAFVIIAASLYNLITAYVYVHSTEFAVTTKRVIVKLGLIRRSTKELNHKQVESLVVDQSILGRIFNYGTIKLIGTGGSTTRLHHIEAPLEFRKRTLEAIQ